MQRRHTRAWVAPMAVWCSVARRSAAGAPCSIAHRVGSYNGGHRFVVGAHPVGDRTVTVLLHPSITERIAALATSWLRSVTHGAGSCNNAAARSEERRVGKGGGRTWRSRG